MLATLLAGGAQLAGNLLAGDAQDRVAKRDLRFKKQVYNEGVERSQPWVDAGQNALAQYMMGFNGGGQQVVDNFRQSPEYLATYNSLMDRAQQGVERRGAATGTLNSGRTAMALQDRAGDIGSQQINNYLARLAGMSGQGLGAAQGANSFANASAQGIGQAQYNQGNALAAQYMGIGGSVNNTLADIYQRDQQRVAQGGTSAFGSWF